MENAQIVDVLNISFFEIESKAIFFCVILERVDSFGLSFTYWWECRWPWKTSKARKEAAEVLNYESFLRSEIENGSHVKRRFPAEA